MENFVDHCFRKNKQLDTNSFWIKGDRTITYSAIEDSARRTQSWLSELGINPGDRLLLLINNDEHLVTLLFGGWLAAASIAIVNPKSTNNELSSILEDLNPAIVFTDNPQNFDSLSSYRVIPIEQRSKKGILSKLKRKKRGSSDLYPDVLKHIPPAPKAATMEGDSEALILCSSGTTGLPKSMALSFSAIETNVVSVIQRMGYTQDHKIHNALPLYHADGASHGPLLILFAGATLVRNKPFQVSQLDEFVGELYRNQINYLISVPTIYSFIHRYRKQYSDLFSWPGFECAVSTAGMLDSSLWKDFENDFNVRIANVYGLSETVFASTICGPNDKDFKRGTVGTPLRGVAIQIRNKDGITVNTGDTGEVFIFGEHLFSGYLNNRESTLDILQDEWLKTGDIGYLDDSGFLNIVGRKKSIIVRGGENINPEEVSQCLLTHPLIFNCEVVALEDEVWGDIIAACIVTDSDALNEAQLMDHCSQYLASYKLPDKFFFMKELPTGPSGKVVRPKLIEQCTQALASNNNEVNPDQDIEGQMFSLAAMAFKIDTQLLTHESEPGNTRGWDSLAHLNFLISLEEHFTIKYTPKEMLSMNNMSAILELTQRKLAKTQTHEFV
ncbi:MAG: AMP-binding protein [Pseudomonadales bacterium]|nr:AMP-binding protein [Pseudomonadales bacterium]